MSVSRETAKALDAYGEMLRQWSAKINLVSPSTLSELYTRHLADSAQLLSVDTDWQSWCDIGSGGGLPGLVVAIHNPERPVTLIESDQRKSVFLKHVSRTLNLNATIVAQRIEEAPPQSADIVSARALAPLDKLIPLSLRHGHKTTRYIFPKGAKWRTEVAEAERHFRFDVDARPSITDKDAVVLVLENIERV